MNNSLNSFSALIIINCFLQSYTLTRSRCFSYLALRPSESRVISSFFKIKELKTLSFLIEYVHVSSPSVSDLSFRDKVLLSSFTQAFTEESIFYESIAVFHGEIRVQLNLFVIQKRKHSDSCRSLPSRFHFSKCNSEHFEREEWLSA